MDLKQRPGGGGEVAAFEEVDRGHLWPFKGKISPI